MSSTTALTSTRRVLAKHVQEETSHSAGIAHLRVSLQTRRHLCTDRESDDRVVRRTGLHHRQVWRIRRHFVRGLVVHDKSSRRSRQSSDGRNVENCGQFEVIRNLFASCRFPVTKVAKDLGQLLLPEFTSALLCFSQQIDRKTTITITWEL